LTPDWPDDPETVEDANAQPEVLAHKTVGQVADHFAEVIGKLKRKPAVIGHSFGGLLTQILAGRELSAASVAIDPAPFRGVLPLPISALKSARPVLPNPANPQSGCSAHPSSAARVTEHGAHLRTVSVRILRTPSARMRRRSCM
jgi:pimeloyl-ACP methyl ester carboxylesterase